MEKTLEVYRDAIGLEVSTRYQEGNDDDFWWKKEKKPMKDDTLLEIVCNPEKQKYWILYFLDLK